MTGEGYSQPEPYCEEDSVMVNFVDDSTAYYGSSDPEQVTRKLGQVYSQVADWMAANKLVINGSKTHLLVASSRAMNHMREEVTLNAGGTNIQSSHEKLLGGIVSYDGKWNRMIVGSKKSIVNQLTTRINALKLLHCGDVKTRLMVATATIQSKLQYLMPLWGGAPGYLLRALQTQQLNAARVVWGYSSYFWSTERLLKKCGWKSVRQQEYHATSMLTHRILQEKGPMNIRPGLVSDWHYNTRGAVQARNQGEVRTHGAGAYEGHSSLVLGNFKSRGQRYYSAIPAEVKLGSYSSVKKKIDKWVRDNIPIR